MKNVAKVLIGALTLVTLFSNIPVRAGGWKGFSDAMSNPKCKVIFGDSKTKKEKPKRPNQKKEEEKDYACDDSMDPTVHEDWFESWTVDKEGKDIYEVWKRKNNKRWKRICWHYIEKE